SRGQARTSSPSSGRGRHRRAALTPSRDAVRSTPPRDVFYLECNVDPAAGLLDPAARAVDARLPPRPRAVVGGSRVARDGDQQRRRRLLARGPVFPDGSTAVRPPPRGPRPRLSAVRGDGVPAARAAAAQGVGGTPVRRQRTPDPRG